MSRFSIEQMAVEGTTSSFMIFECINLFTHEPIAGFLRESDAEFFLAAKQAVETSEENAKAAYVADLGAGVKVDQWCVQHGLCGVEDRVTCLVCDLPLGHDEATGHRARYDGGEATWDVSKAALGSGAGEETGGSKLEVGLKGLDLEREAAAYIESRRRQYDTLAFAIVTSNIDRFVQQLKDSHKVALTFCDAQDPEEGYLCDKPKGHDGNHHALESCDCDDTHCTHATACHVVWSDPVGGAS